MGIVLNRPTDLHLNDIVAQLDIPPGERETGEQTIYLGGPVQTDRGFVLHTPARRWDSTLQINPDISVTTSRDILQAIVEGEGPEKEKLKELAGSLYLTDRVSFPGKLPPDQLAGHLQQSDLYVSLIRSEGLSASLLESCACGVLPVVLDIPASRHLLKDGENGILLPPDLPAEKIGKKLISAYEDLALRKQVATQNPPRIRQAFDRRKNLQRFLEVYQNLCRKK